MIIKRLLGLIMLAAGLALFAASMAGAYTIGQFLDQVVVTAESAVNATVQGLDTARSSITLARTSFADLETALGSAVQLTGNTAVTLADSQTLITDVGTVVTQEVPEAVEGIQDAIPGVLEVAQVIDRTLSTLSQFRIDREISLPFGLSVPLQFDLGVDYSPEQPFDQTLQQFSTSLEGVPESMRALETELSTTVTNLGVLASDMEATSTDLAVIAERTGELVLLMDEYEGLVNDVEQSAAQAIISLEQQLELLKTFGPVLMVLLSLSQLAPIYLGWELLTARRRPADAVVVATPVDPATPAKTADPLEDASKEPDTAEV